MAQPNPPFGEGPSEQNPAQFSSATWLYFTSWKPLFSYRCHPVKILWWENSADSRYQGWRSRPLPGIRRGSGQQATHSQHTYNFSMPKVGAWFKPTPAFTSPQSGGTGSRSSGDAWSFCFVQEVNTKGVLYPGSCDEGKLTVPYCNSTSGLFPPFWDLQHPVKGDSASPVARGLMKLRRSLDMHSHTERNRFELEGLCGCLALNLKCTVTPSFFQLKAKCLSSSLKIHGCQNICWSDKLQKQRPHSDSREESHCYKPAPGECSIPTYKTEHYPKVKRK